MVYHHIGALQFTHVGRDVPDTRVKYGILEMGGTSQVHAAGRLVIGLSYKHVFRRRCNHTPFCIPLSEI